jgi:hypothetical protein
MFRTLTQNSRNFDEKETPSPMLVPPLHQEVKEQVEERERQEVREL